MNVAQQEVIFLSLRLFFWLSSCLLFYSIENFFYFLSQERQIFLLLQPKQKIGGCEFQEKLMGLLIPSFFRKWAKI